VRRVAAASIVLSILLAFAPFARGAPADEVRALLEQGRARDAYELGSRHPGELGKPDFDFWYGVAAVDSGHAGEGVLALERYIVRFPDNDRARLELARAYFVLGELVRAREEFDAVSRRNPPAGVQVTIDRFMDAIRAQETRYNTTATLYVELGGGYDSNVNSGVGNPVISVPTLGQIQLAPSGTKSGDSFFHLAAGGQFSHPVAPGLSLIGGASAEGKFHNDDFDQNFDQAAYTLYGGGSYVKQRNLLRGTLSFSMLEVDYRRFREAIALGGEWHVQVGEFDTASLFAQYAQLEYPSSPVRDADFYGVGLGWRHGFVAAFRPIFQVQALYGKEKNDAEPARDDLTRDLYTLRGSLSLTPAPRWGASLGLAYTKSRFDEADPLFQKRRDDDYYGIELGASYRFTKRLSLRADYLHAENSSNIPLYEYDRDVITLRARYEL
jgi:tetratricopeptide (TPR) repeat protein